jgi:ferrochelatase
MKSGPAPAKLPCDRLDPHEPAGLILCGMGGPDGPESVGPFLRNLFNDPAVLPLPAPLARLVGGLIARRRTRKVRERYASLGCGGGSPQLDWTRRQAQRLSKLLAARGLDVSATPAMRYWHPFSDEAVVALGRRDLRQYLVVPTYPQFSAATSGSVLAAVQRAVRQAVPDARLHVVADWHLLPGYLDALMDQAEPILRSWAAAGHEPSGCALLPLAHSLPLRFVRRGDPYLAQTRATVAALRARLAARLADPTLIDPTLTSDTKAVSGERLTAWWDALPGGGQPLLAFQSKVGPVRWLGPDSVAETLRLAQAGCRRLLVLPVSFTCEHIETLHELDRELARIAREAGVLEFVRGAALNLDRGWLESLASHLAETAFGEGTAGGNLDDARDHGTVRPADRPATSPHREASRA